MKALKQNRFFFCALMLMTAFLVLAGCGSGGGAGSNQTGGSAGSTHTGGGGAVIYTVTYDGNGNTGGSVPAGPSGCSPGQTETVSGNTGGLVKTGYMFAGWNTKADGSGTTYAQGQTFTMVPSNITLYAMWTQAPTYTVTYNGNGSTGGSVPPDTTNYQQGQTVTVPGNTGGLVKYGYSFTGWNTQSDGGGTTYSQGQTFTIGAQDVILYAMWTLNPTYTVTYSGNGSTSGSVPPDTTNYELGQTVKVSGNTGNLVKAGYTFEGWNTQSDGGGDTYRPGQAFTIGTTNVILYAVWVTPVYNVSYSGNGNTGGDVPYDPTAYQQGQTVTVQGNPGSLVRSGYVFAGWNTEADGSGTTYAQGQTFTIGAQDVILYAMWTLNPTYIVIYDGNGSTGGSVPSDSTSYQQGQTVTVQGNPGSLVRSGYVFAGWNTESDGSGTIYTQGQTFTMAQANITLYAKWASSLSEYAYVVNLGDGTVSQYTIVEGGGLAPMTPAMVNAGYSYASEPLSVVVDPSGRYAYVVNLGDGTVAQYKIGSNGTLIPMNPASVAAGKWPEYVTVDPSGRYVYVTDAGYTTISQFTIGIGGGLSPMSPATAPAVNGPAGIAVDPSGKYVYAANEGDSTISQYTIGPDGSLTAMSPWWVRPTTQNGAILVDGTDSVAVDPSDRYVYAANEGNNTVSQFTISSDGTLAAMSPVTVASGSEPWSIVVDPSGRYVYVANKGDNTVSQYTIGVGGALIPMSPASVPAGLVPTSITVDPSGRFVYVTNGGDNTVSQYIIGEGGALTPVNPPVVPTGTRPCAVFTTSAR